MVVVRPMTLRRPLGGGAGWWAAARRHPRHANGRVSGRVGRFPRRSCAFGGNFLYSTGANETAGRFTACHFDFPMRECTVELDGVKVVERGKLSKEML